MCEVLRRSRKRGDGEDLAKPAVLVWKFSGEGKQKNSLAKEDHFARRYFTVGSGEVSGERASRKKNGSMPRQGQRHGGWVAICFLLEARGTQERVSGSWRKERGGMEWPSRGWAREKKGRSSFFRCGGRKERLAPFSGKGEKGSRRPIPSLITSEQETRGTSVGGKKIKARHYGGVLGEGYFFAVPRCENSSALGHEVRFDTCFIKRGGRGKIDK